MTLTLHRFDGREVKVESSDIAFVLATIIGGRKCTRIRLTSGKDVVVHEPISDMKGQAQGKN